MKKASRVGSSLMILVVVILITSMLVTRVNTSGRSDYQVSEGVGERGQSNRPEDPCWFATLKDRSLPFYEKIKQRDDLEIQGYPQETPLPEAIRTFNEENQCSSVLRQYPPLTEDELIAAIVAGTDYPLHEEPGKAQRDALWKIATRRVMPKGSLLVASSSGRVQESPLRPSGTIQAEGIRIDIFLGLESHELGQPLRPEQIFLVRKTYFKVATIK